MSKKRKKKLSHKLKISPHLIPFVIFSAIILILMIFLLPTKLVTTQEEVERIELEEYTVEVPYEDIEEYVESVPYETTEQYIEAVPRTEEIEENSCDENSGCSCLETHWFWGYCTSCSCIVYEDVLKEKSVTKYRDETKYKTVTKTRIETREREVRKVGVMDVQKEVNWVFGFDAIIKFKTRK